MSRSADTVPEKEAILRAAGTGEKRTEIMRWTEEELLRMEHPVSKKHPPMSLENRAAQFAPYAALTGFGRIITEAGRQQAAQAQKGDILRESEPESTDQFESDDLI